MKKHPDVTATEEIYKTAREHADLEISRLKENIEGQCVEQFISGALAKIDYDNTHNKLLKYALLYQYKQKREYLKGGKSWEDFLDTIGEDRSTVGRIFNDLKPIYDELQGKLHCLAGIRFSKIRYLGKANGAICPVLDGDCLVINGEKIPLNHADEIESAIDAMKDAHKQEKESMEAVIKAKERIIKGKDEVIHKQEAEISRHERHIKENGFAPGEEEFLRQLKNIRVEATSIFNRLDPERIDLGDATPRMVASYMEMVGYLHRMARATHDTAIDHNGHPDIDGGWNPQPIYVGGALSKVVGHDDSPKCQACKDKHPACQNCCNTCSVPCEFKQTCTYE